MGAVIVGRFGESARAVKEKARLGGLKLVTRVLQEIAKVAA